VLECWSFKGTFGVGLSSLRERVDPLLQVLPTQALGRTGSLLPLRLDRRFSDLRGDFDFWRLLIHKPFRLGFVGRVS
jgi:hypothetical protein